MVKLEEILEMWKSDSVIDRVRASSELLQIPILHAKYIEILSQHRLASHKMKFEYAKMKKIRREYYLGALDRETLEEFGWDQFDLKIGTKGNIEYYLDSDSILIKILEKKSYYDECVSLCEGILKEISSRTFQLREFLIHTRYENGV